MGKKKSTTAQEKENDLNLKREAFCQHYTKKNATRSYAEAFGYKLDELSHEAK
jgi:hypothetical protein